MPLTPLTFPGSFRTSANVMKLKIRKLALTYYNEAMALAKRTGNQIAEASISDVIGHFYLREKDLKRAETYLQSALQLGTLAWSAQSDTACLCGTGGYQTSARKGRRSCLFI